MSGGHAHTALLVGADSPLHRLRPECKVAAAVLLVLAIVAAPREAFWVYGCFTLLVVGLARLGQVPLGLVARRLTIELPFVAFAFLLPFVARGEQVDVAGVGVSVEGLWAAWNILVKATLGVAVTALLAATTPVADLLRGLERLRMPRLMTAIAGFMVRYGDVLTGEARRMQVARLSRGDDPRWLWQTKALATSSGALFVRSFERGERVHLAMRARGFTGALPDLDDLPAASRASWAAALAVPACAAALSATAWWW